MGFQDAVKLSKIIETVETYSVNGSHQIVPDGENDEGVYFLDDEQHFWNLFIATPDYFENRKISILAGTISDWVARIPGLYWHQDSRSLRDVSDALIEFRSAKWTAWSPSGKTSKVLGGIGTSILPPDIHGMKIMTVCIAGNASSGIPILISPEVIAHHRIKQGDEINVKGAYWRQMSMEWSERFPTSREIKRGYLVIDHPDQVKKLAVQQPVEIHPFTIMEYQSGNALFYDYVYAAIDTAYPNYRGELENFFENYKKDKDRKGIYLIAADTYSPLFDARFVSPEALLRSTTEGRSQLALLVERIQNSFYYSGETIKSIMQLVPTHYYTASQIQSLAIKVGISPALIPNGPAAAMSASLIDLCLKNKSLEVLVDVVHRENLLKNLQ